MSTPCEACSKSKCPICNGTDKTNATCAKEEGCCGKGKAKCPVCKDARILEADELSPRYKRAISIILEAEPDLVSVQECDRAEKFTTVMEKAGYGVYFNKKTASATTRAGVGMDCVGIFYNKRTFEEVYGPRKIFLPNAKKNSSSTVGKQAAMWLLLRRRENGRLVAVVTAHLKSGKELGDDGLLKQMQAARMAEILREELGPNVPIIFGCDFNNGTETESYVNFRRQVPFMAEAYEDTYGRSPTWGSSKWRSGGDQTEKIGYTPNNIDFVFYTRRFFKPLAVLAYPNWEAEPLEACNLPGYKYPSDHFAHMAVFEERDVTPEVALTEEMYHLVKRDQVTPCYDQAVYEDSGKLVRMDYRFYFPECPEAADILAFLSNDPEVAEKKATVFETFKKYRPYRNMGEVEFNQRFNVDVFTAAKQADTVDYNTYCEKVTDQALRMNKHNQLRVDMEKEDG